MENSNHRVTVWAGGVKGWPVSCTCGWRVYAKTRDEGYAKMREHKNDSTTPKPDDWDIYRGSEGFR